MRTAILAAAVIVLFELPLATGGQPMPEKQDGRPRYIAKTEAVPVKQVVRRPVYVVHEDNAGRRVTTVRWEETTITRYHQRTVYILVTNNTKL